MSVDRAKEQGVNFARVYGKDKIDKGDRIMVTNKQLVHVKYGDKGQVLTAVKGREYYIRFDNGEYGWLNESSITRANKGGK